MKMSEMQHRDINALINQGIVELEYADANTVKRHFSALKEIITHEVIDSIPENIDNIAIRGRFESNTTGKRRGIYYGRSVDKYLLEKAPLFQDAYKSIQEIALDWLSLIEKKYNLESLRDGICFDTLTLALYNGTDKISKRNGTDEDISLKGHTDYGLITIGCSNEEGLELYNDGKWITVPCNTPYIHTGKWLQQFLESKGIIPHKAIHRVKTCNKDRFFLGFFLEPASSSTFNDKTYGEFISEQFTNTYGTEHRKVSLPENTHNLYSK